MINSLTKDSHTYPSFSQTSKLNKTKSMASNVTLHSGLISNKMDSVSFTGFPGARLANTEIVKTVSKAAKDFIQSNGSNGKKVTTKAVSKLVSEATSVIAGNTEVKASDLTKNFIKQNSGTMNEFVDSAKKLIFDSKPDIKKEKLFEELAKEASFAVETLPTVEKIAQKGGKSFYKSEALEKVFNVANDNSAVFNSLFAAVLACALRPATIMAMPAKGSNKEDNRYSAAHSIASGLTGAAVAFLFNNPIASGIKEFASDPAKYLKDEKFNKFEKLYGEKEKIVGPISNKTFDTGKRALNLCTDLAFGIPQALLTIALIPPILKKLGIQKSSAKKAQAEATKQNTVADNTNSKDKKQVSFGGRGDKEASWVTKKIASGVSNIFNWKPFNWLVNKALEEDKLVEGLTTAKSALISGLYVGRTLSNKNLDPNRKTTLAINQASVWAVATALGLTFNKFVDKAVDKFSNNYRAANVNRLMEKYGNDIGAAEKHINALTGGIKAAKSLVVMTTVYRYISPVLVTPLANKIGNIVEAKRNEKAAEVAKA